MSLCFVAASSQYVDCGDINALDGVQNFTICAWIMRQTGSKEVLIYKGISGTQEIYIYLRNNGRTLMTVKNGGSNYLDSNSTAANDSSWHHFALVFDGTQGVSANRIKMYIDGSIVTGTPVGTFPTSTHSNAGSFSLGQRIHTGTYSDGDIGECRIYTNSLSADQVKSDYYGYFSDLDLIGYWPLGVATTEPDWSGNGNVGTRINSPTVSDNPPVGSPYMFTGGDPYEVISSSGLPVGTLNLMGVGV